MAQTTIPPLMNGLMVAAHRPLIPASDYLAKILNREAVPVGLLAPVSTAYEALMPAIDQWANGNAVSVEPSGSFAKGTANSSGTDLDLFLSIPPDVTTPVKQAYHLLAQQLRRRGFSPKMQNVSIGVTLGALSIDLVPARQQNPFCDDHTVYHRQSGNWRKTNIWKHINYVRSSGRQGEIRILKLWRDQHGFEFPSFYMELAVIRALTGSTSSNLSDNVGVALEFLASKFASARFVDPANQSNVISDDLTASEKLRIQTLARRALNAPWTSLVH